MPWTSCSSCSGCVEAVRRGSLWPCRPRPTSKLSRGASPPAAIDGVTGLGTPGGVLVVYLENDSAVLRREVDAALRAEGVPETHVVVTGEFKAQ